MLVCSLLEYSCAVWDSYLQRGIDKLESVQRLAYKICIKNSLCIPYAHMISFTYSFVQVYGMAFQ